MDLNRRLNKISGPLRRARKDRQYAEDRERELRRAFFKLADEGVEERVEYFDAKALGENEEDARAYLAKKYPHAFVHEIRYDEDGYIAVMVTRPEFISFEFVDERGRVVKRKVKGGEPTIDLELLRKIDEHMFDCITVPVTTWTIDDDKFERYLTRHPEKLAILERVSYPKKPVASLEIVEDK
jgi:hypothetical protein